MSFITFNYNKNLIYAIIYWALEIVYRAFMYLKWNYFSIAKKDSINEYIYVILLNISDLLAGFLVLYINSTIKKKKEIGTFTDDRTSSSFIGKIEIISGETKTLQKSKYYIYKMILICILDYLNRSCFFIFYQIFKNATFEEISHKAQKDIIIHLDIIARYVFSIFILKTKVSKHHKVAILIIFIGFIILVPVDYVSINFFSTKINAPLTYIQIATIIYRGILFPFEDTIVKKVFIDDYVLPEVLMFLRGLGEFVIILVITPFLYFFIRKNDDSYFEFNNDLTNVILMIIFYTLSSFVKAYLLVKVIYYFSSQSVSFLIISESLTGSVADIIKFFIENENSYDIITLLLEIIVIIITTFGTLIYDEIIVIKKWGMDKNVAKEITSRGELELNSLGTFNDYDNEVETEEEETPKE